MWIYKSSLGGVMRTNGTNEAINLGKNMGKIKSASVLTGLMYAIVFILMLPFYMNQGYQFDSILKITGVFVASAIIVHLILNGLYYLMIVVPLIMAVLIGGAGWLIWVNAPLLIGVFVSTFSIFDIDLSWMIESATRIGQTMMALAGGIWWIVKKGKEINYAALYIYLIILAMIGITSGFINPSITYVFLMFWAVVSYKIHEHPTVDTNSQLSIIFKIVASLSILIATLRSISFARLTWYGETNDLVVIYAMLVFLAVSFGIWAPQKLLKLLPSSLIKRIQSLIDIIKKAVYLSA